MGLFDLTDDLTPNQFQALLTWHWTKKLTVTRASLKSWRKQQGL